ncbi:MAG: GtrA family protein [Myxococcales bacterium]
MPRAMEDSLDRSPRALPLAVRLSSRLAGSWAMRGFLAGGLGAAVDVALLVALVHFGRVEPVVATAVGVVVGGAVNFAAHKYLAFRDRDRKLGLQALRYASGFSLAFVLYEAVYYALTVHFGLDYLLAKLLSDVLVFTGGGLLLNRYVIFPERTMLAQDAVRTLCCLSLGIAFTGSPSLSAGQLFAQAIVAAPDAQGPGPVEVSVPPATASQPIAAQAAAREPARVRGGLAFRHDLGWRVPRAPDLEKQRRPPRA